ncbi:hypothetical protein J2X20_002947 [Pelomonas saccharophila]|uniref:Uncharacterized protein n=1 Tax=Roseateles saccharophilus TaxID=304 RepID=A0ABU1YN57_ROSSA|nr:hypothetical protein [Roseateles saccharophilus]MDR7270289.1 hypothetical protein [Roseateles saccharophilus]
MSINYQFTDRGTIQVWCGDDWIEIRLPGGGGGDGDAARPRARAPDVSDVDSDAAPAAVPDEEEADPEPQVGPGSMSFIGMVGGLGRPPRALLWSAAPTARGFELSNLESGIVEQMMPAPGLGDVRIVAIDLNSLPLKSPLSVVQLNRLLRNWQADDGGAGLGTSERNE